MIDCFGVCSTPLHSYKYELYHVCIMCRIQASTYSFTCTTKLHALPPPLNPVDWETIAVLAAVILCVFLLLPRLQQRTHPSILYDPQIVLGKTLVPITIQRTDGSYVSTLAYLPDSLSSGHKISWSVMCCNPDQAHSFALSCPIMIEWLSVFLSVGYKLILQCVLMS